MPRATPQWFFLSAIFLALFGAIHCVPPPPESGCAYHHECGDNATCEFEQPSCYTHLGTCRGRCKATETPEVSCNCKDDSECNYPFEACANCRCYKRDVRVCTSDTDCGQGWRCIGEVTRVCEIRTTCTKDGDCLPENRCNQGRCCNPSAGNCGSSCQQGTPCTTQQDCAACNQFCEAGTCRTPNTSCNSQSCTTSADCTFCLGSCVAGSCQRANNPPTCQTQSCFLDDDCQRLGYASCVGGCCR